MYKSRLLGAVWACLVIVPFNAVASIIDYGTYVTDTATGWDWLDLTQTAGMSYEEVTLQLGPGGLYEGWSYANRDELETLWAAFGGDAAHYAEWSVENDGLFNAIAPIMGDLYCERTGCTTGTGFSHWMTADIATTEDVLADFHTPKTVAEGQRVLAVIVNLYSRYQSDTMDYVNLTQVTMSDFAGDLEVGSALFRVSAAAVVPVPAAVWLFGSGLLSLAGVARRGRAA